MNCKTRSCSMLNAWRAAPGLGGDEREYIVIVSRFGTQIGRRSASDCVIRDSPVKHLPTHPRHIEFCETR
jgi:hypothetical protein